MLKILLPATLAVLVLPAAAHATGGEVGVRASTLGLGVYAGARLGDHLSLRAIANGYDRDYHHTSDDIRYAGKMKLGSAGLQLDYRPAADGSFYLTAGLYANGNKVRETATPTSNARVGGISYTPAQIGTLTGRARFQSAAPYLGLGWNFPVGPVAVNLEAGAYFQGKARVTLTSDGTYAADPSYQAALEQERLSLRHDLNKLSTWPVAALGVSYRF